MISLPFKENHEARGFGTFKNWCLPPTFDSLWICKFVLGGEIFKGYPSAGNHLFLSWDFKPPLVVYFLAIAEQKASLKDLVWWGLGCPFLWFDQRLDGGVFYLVKDELEEGIRTIIQEHMELARFLERELIPPILGISMGNLLFTPLNTCCILALEQLFYVKTTLLILERLVKRGRLQLLSSEASFPMALGYNFIITQEERPRKCYGAR